jgi:hypothetical protein
LVATGAALVATGEAWGSGPVKRGVATGEERVQAREERVERCTLSVARRVGLYLGRRLGELRQVVGDREPARLGADKMWAAGRMPGSVSSEPAGTTAKPRSRARERGKCRAVVLASARGHGRTSLVME